MKDERKFKLLTYFSAILIALTLSYNILQEHLISGIEGYLERKVYYENVISKKGLSLHKGMYWREKE